MSNLFIISFLALVVMNIFLWIRAFIRERSEAQVISIIAHAIKRGDGNFEVYWGSRYLSLFDKDTQHLRTLHEKDMQLLLDYLNIKIVKIAATPEEYTIVKKGKKA